MAEFDDEHEEWWLPFQALWKTDDKAWMKERRAQWDCINKNKRLADIIDDEDEIRGIRSLFMTGSVFDRHYEPASLFDFETDDRMSKMRVEGYFRIRLLPDNSEAVLQQFLESLTTKFGQTPFRYMTSVLFFRSIVAFLNNSDSSNDLVVNIYQYLMGGGGILDNSRLMSSYDVSGSFIKNRVDKELMYFIDCCRYCLSDRAEDPKYLLSLFDYYRSMSNYLAEQDEHLHEHYADPGIIEKVNRSLAGAWQLSLNKIRSSEKQKDPLRAELREKVLGLIESEEFPKLLRALPA